MKILFALLGIALGSATAAFADGAGVLTFDDVSPDQLMLIPNGYHDLQWANFYIENGINNPQFGVGATSSPNVAYDGFGHPASLSGATPFTVLSAYLTAVYVPTQQINVQGYAEGIMTYNNTYTVSDTPTLIDFNYVGVDQLTFTIVTSPTGIFAMDDFTYAVPEPGVCVLFPMAAVMGMIVFPGSRRNLP